jgi:6-phosphogluconate dehydrogenase (decarboxylating)
MKIGFVGVGNIGHHLAASLLREGFSVTVFDLDKAAVDRLVAIGASAADSPRDVASSVACSANARHISHLTVGGAVGRGIEPPSIKPYPQELKH